MMGTSRMRVLSRPIAGDGGVGRAGGMPMKRRSVGSLLVVACLAVSGVLVASCDRRGRADSGASGIRRVALVARAPATDYWEAVHAGAAVGAREAHKIILNYRGPGVDNDAAMQAAVVRELIASKVDALVIGPADDAVLAGPLVEARDAKIPVVIIDRDLQPRPGDGIIAVVAVDNSRGGELAAQRMGETLKHGQAALFRHDRADPNSSAREEGFVAAMAGNSGLTLVDPRFYSGRTVAEAKKAADTLLVENPEIKAVFCSSEASAHGMVLALRERFLNGKVKVIGFESSLFLVEALALGDVDALVVPDPVKLGRLALQAAAGVLDGKPVPARQGVGVVLVTRANMLEDETKMLLLPDLSPTFGGE